jgi:hypothetical protein
VDNFSSEVSFVMRGRNNLAAIRTAFRFLCLLFLIGLPAGAVKSADVPSAPIPLLRPGLPFAIADFDGDSRLDLASVGVGQSDFTNTEYWIQLQLSAAGRQSIRLIAPAGGLQIVARDVNGDKSLDLIVSTAWSNRPVAVYLNDGHGGFTHSEPAAFPGAFGESQTSWTSVSHQVTDAVGIPPQSRPGICSEISWLSRLQSHEGAVAVSEAQSFFGSFLDSLRDRAPPSQVPHL